jgi:hypothetical protein
MAVVPQAHGCSLLQIELPPYGVFGFQGNQPLRRLQGNFGVGGFQ